MATLTEEAFMGLLHDVLSPDPATQQRNVATLDQLVRSPTTTVIAYALTVLSVGSAAHSLPVRQAAASVLKRLLKQNPAGTLAAGLPVLHTQLLSLLDAVATEAHAALATAVASLIATFMAEASDQLSPASVDPLWAVVLGFVEQEVGRAVGEERPLGERECIRVAGTMMLLQVLCEDCSSQLQQWIVPYQANGRGANDGIPSARSLALCNVFHHALSAGCTALATVVDGRVPSAPLLSVSVRAFTGTLAALTSCFEESVLPFEDPFGDEDNGEDSVAGPAVAGLSAVLAQVAALHARVEGITLSTVFPWVEKQCQHGELEDTPAKVLIALFRYMSLMVLAPGKEIRGVNERLLLAAVPLLTENLWPANANAEADEARRAVEASLLYIGDAALLANSKAFFLCLPRVLSAVLPLAALSPETVSSPDFADLENDWAVPDDATTVKLVLSRGHAGASAALETSDGDSDTKGKALLRDEDEEDGMGGNTRRAAVAAVIRNISTAYENPGHLVDCLFPSASALLNAYLADHSRNDPRVVEAVFFALNGVVEECLASAQLSQPQVCQIGNVVCTLLQSLDSGRLTSSGGVPFYVRQQVVRFLGRSTAAVVESLLRKCPSPVLGLLDAAPPRCVLHTLSSLLCNETSKAVQKQCIAAMTSICAASLQPALESLELDDDDDSESCENTADTQPHRSSLVTSACCTDALAFGRHLRLDLFSPADDAPIQMVFTQLTAALPRVQLGARTAIYDFFSTVIPRMDDRGVPFHPLVVGNALEALAVHCQALGFQPGSPSSGEAAYALVTISQVVAALGGLVAPAVPFFTAMARRAMEVYLVNHHQTSSLPSSSSSESPAGSTGSAIDLEDVCALSMDLLSALCDALVEHDALLPLVLNADLAAENAGASPTFANFCSLRHELFSPSEGSSANVLQLCVLALSTFPPPAQGDDHQAGQECNELRRATYGLLYDCLFLASPEQRAELFWPLVEQVVVRELGALMNAKSMKQVLQFVDRNEATVANALLCLAGLLFLHPSSGGATTVFAATLDEARPFLQQAVSELLTILRDKGKAMAALPTNVRLNMVNALSGLGALLYDSSGSALSQPSAVSDAAEQCVGMLQTVANELGRFASALAEDGCYECVQVLTGLCRIARSLCTTLQAALPGLLSSNKRLATALAKALVVVAKCAKVFPDAQASAAALGDWAGVAEAFQVAGLGSLQLSKAEKQAIVVVRSFRGGQ